MQLHKYVSNWKELDQLVITTAPHSLGVICVERFHEPREDKQPDAFIYNLHVRSTCRKRGLGKRLLRAALKWCREQGCHNVRLVHNSVDSPRWVYDWYVREGFSEVGFTPGPDGTKSYLQILFPDEEA